MSSDIEAALSAARDRGVVIVDPRQTYIGPEVALERLSRGAVLHPGTRLTGARTFLGPGAEVGAEGPAVLKNAVLGERARVDSGYAEDAVLLRDARAGANAHLREGTLLEEQASIAHAVGLKHTILGSFVTLGSLINFCDVLMTGGTSRDDHSEVGSGFIHFNFTPWGKRGDKATASLVGDVVHGMLLRQPRIFLGGAGGMVGPRQVGFGAVAAAGQVLRADLAPGRLVAQGTPAMDMQLEPGRLDRPEKRAAINVRYLAELTALRAFYRQIRRARVPAAGPHAYLAIVYDEALRTIDRCIDERVKRFEAFLRERGRALPPLIPAADPPCPLAVSAAEPYQDHVEWIRALSAGDVDVLYGWLDAVAAAVAERGRELGPPGA